MYSDQNDRIASAWPIATYQGILLYLILCLLKSRQSCHSHQCSLSQLDYEILVVLVQTCRRHRLFFYPTMLGRHHGINSMACIWVGVEEIKRLGIALYRVCKSCSDGSNVGGHELLTLSDLQFPMPDSDELWNAETNTTLSRRLAKVDPSATLHGWQKHNWISDLGVALFGSLPI